MEKIKIKDFIDIADVKSAVDFVVNIVFEDGGEYKPYIKSFAIDYATLMFFTDFATLELYKDMFKNENGDFNLIEFYRFMNTNEAVHDVLIKFNSTQYKDFIKAVEETISYKLQSQYHSNKIFEVISYFSNMIENVEYKEKIIDAVSEIIKNQNGISQ